MSSFKKHRSNIVFGGVVVLLFAFFFSPLWDNLYTYLISLNLEAPNIEENLRSDENIYFDKTWTIYKTDETSSSIQDFDKPIFINFFATWCAPCKSEFPSIIKLHDQFKNKIEFIIVSPDEDLSIIKKYEEYYEFPLPFYNSNRILPLNVAVNSYPTTYIIDKNKKILLTIQGAHDWSTKNVIDFLNKLSKE